VGSPLLSHNLTTAPDGDAARKRATAFLKCWAAANRERPVENLDTSLARPMPYSKSTSSLNR
jgi:hypothetical protein